MRLKTVTNCARCGGEHTDVDAHEFGRPCGRHTHWSTCPTTGEPVLVRIVTDAAQPGATESAARRAMAPPTRTTADVEVVEIGGEDRTIILRGLTDGDVRAFADGLGRSVRVTVEVDP